MEAYITYGWESRTYYRNWLGFDDPHTIREMRGATLVAGSPQSALAPALLNLVKNILIKDEDYVERIKGHYRMFRARIDGSSKIRVGHNNRRKKKQK